ncbi:MAG: hypothetical protein QME41_10895, partial [Actinomycetota bacterium]|nr:hypothetical protein [Actinomycetota bacterium]
MSNPQHNKTRIAIAYSGAHPAHIKMLADVYSTSILMLGNWSINRDISIKNKFLLYVSTALKLRKSAFEIIIIEGTTQSALMAPFINCRNPKSKIIITLSAEDGLYRAFAARKLLDRILIGAGFRYISGIIASGDLVAKLAEQHLKPMPIAIRYPQLPDEASKSLLAVEPSLDSHNMLLIGSGSALCKGVDIASQSLAFLSNEFPDAQLTTVGRLDIEEQPGVNPQGPVDDIK